MAVARDCNQLGQLKLENVVLMVQTKVLFPATKGQHVMVQATPIGPPTIEPTTQGVVVGEGVVTNVVVV